MKISPSKKGIPSYPVLMKTLGLAATAASLVSCEQRTGGLVENPQVPAQNQSVTTLPGEPLPPSEPERPPQATAGEIAPERTDALCPEEEPLQLGGDVPYVPENNEDDE